MWLKKGPGRVSLEWALFDCIRIVDQRMEVVLFAELYYVFHFIPVDTYPSVFVNMSQLNQGYTLVFPHYNNAKLQ
jgi:hypothetical protein